MKVFRVLVKIWVQFVNYWVQTLGFVTIKGLVANFYFGHYSFFAFHAKSNFKGIRMNKKIILPLFALFALSACSSFYGADNSIGIMSYNIRCEPCESQTSINHWSVRKDLVVQIVKSKSPDFLGLQEASENQTNQLASAFPEYNYYGLGREQGETGERNTLFYNRSRFSPVSQKTIWLNEDGAKFELGWDASWIRTATIIVFKDKAKNQEIAVINTHLDNDGKTARGEAAKIIGNEILSLGKMPIILMGDFNDTPQSYAHGIFDEILDDTIKYKAEDFTFNGFGARMEKGFVIDYIMTSADLSAKHGEIIYKLLNNQFPSDHFPIYSKVDYANKQK